jgi:predicted nucleic acid-binding protein
VLPRRKFARRVAASGLTVPQLVGRYALLAQSTTPAAIGPVSADPDDDHVLACALAANADLVVSGDSHLLDLKSYQNISIVGAADALQRIAAR